MKMSTGERIHPKDWSQTKRRPKSTAPASASLNKYLDRLEARVRETHLELKSGFEPITPDRLKDAVTRDIKTNGKKETLLDYFERYIVESTGRKSRSLGALKSALKSFKGYPGPKNFDDINAKWFEKYQAYMERNKYSANYIGKHVGIFRMIMAGAKKEGLTNNTAFKDTDYRRPSEDVETIYLTEHELLYIYGIELPDYLDRVRNRFIIGAFSGLRFSDSAKITHDSIREGLMFDRNKKTGNDVVIPIHWVIEQIFKDHPEGLPPSISNQKTNRYLKEIGQRAGINDTIIINKKRGGEIVTESHKKYELITTHTARRSAATNMYIAGIPTLSIMTITGHRTEESFMKYIRISKEENAKLMQNHSFFAHP